MAYKQIVSDYEYGTSSTGGFTEYAHTIGRDRNGIANYKQLIQQGSILPVNYYKFSESTFRQSSGNWPEPWTYSTTCFTHRGGPFFSFPETMQELKEECVTKATRGFYDNHNDADFNMGVAAAELPLALTMVGATAARLATAFTRLKRFDIPGTFRALGAGSGPHYRSLLRRSNNAKRQAIRSGNLRDAGEKFAAGTWLEIKYGWKPLLQDVHGASERLGRAQVQSNPTETRTRSSAQSECGLVEAFTDTVGGRLTGKRKASLRINVLSRIENPALRSAAGLGLTNPLSIAWEVLPFSFVVDWFVPVGNYIDSLDTTQGTSFSQGTMSWKLTEKYSGAIDSLKYAGEWYGMNLPIESESFTFEREVMTAFPDNKELLKPKKPSRKSFVNKAITGVALLKQVFG